MKKADSKIMKSINRRTIIEQIINNKSISRAEIASNIGLNKATVSSQVSELLEMNLIVESINTASNVGRTPIPLSINKSIAFSIGIEIDINKIIIVATNLIGEIIDSDTIHLCDTSSNILIEEIYKAIDRSKSKACKFELIGISVGVHCIVDNESIIGSHGHLNLKDLNLKAKLEERYNLPVNIQNNNHFSVLAEKTYNYHKNSNILYLNISSGIGLGIIIDNKIYRGLHGYAGEIGHNIVDLNGKQCRCGNRGCLEMYCGEKNVYQSLANTGTNLSDPLSFDDFKNNEILIEFCTFLAIGLNNLINSFNPEIIIVNSNILNHQPAILSEIENTLSSTMNHYEKIVFSHFGDKTCALGASIFNIKRYLDIDELYLD